MPTPPPISRGGNEQAAALIASLGPGIFFRAWTADAQGRRTSGFDSVASYSGLTRAQLDAQGWNSIYHPEDRPGIEAHWARCVESKQPYEHHHRVRRADGVYRWFLTRANPVFENGVVTHWLGVTVDMDTFINAHLAATEGTQRLFALGSMTASLIFTADADGAFSTPQPDWERYTGQSFEQYAGWGRMDAIHPDSRDQMREAWRQAVATGTELRFRGGIWHAASKSYRSMIARAVPIKSSDGSIIEWVGAYTDILSLYAQVSQWVIDRDEEPPADLED
ncbi:MAG: PAS domain-containing protein [Acidobacteriota bacterium]